jgi:hypothetical protein
MLVAVLTDIASKLVNSQPISKFCTETFSKQLTVFLGVPGMISLEEFTPVVVISNVPALECENDRDTFNIKIQIYIASSDFTNISNVRSYKGYLWIEELAELVRAELMKGHGGKSVSHSSYPSDTYPLWYCEEVVKVVKAGKKQNF